MMPGVQLDEKDIFHIARRIDCPEVRAEYLQQVSGGDPLLMDRVNALIKGFAQQVDFLEAPAVGAATRITEPLPEGPPIQIGPYKLVEKIGEGGMGTVFMAEQKRPVRRTVALKVVKPGMDSRQVIARFQAERQALALMNHPHIAQVLDAGNTESGQPYFVMELVRGIPITEYCDQAQRTTRERLELFIQVCQAIQHAHQRGVIHRDLKPSNVMVTLHDGVPVPKVIDFGIAKAVNRPLIDQTLLTNYAQMVGTPLYMSPEQAELSGLDVDTRSDIYSLGVLLYELLTGCTPFDRQRLREATFDEWRRIIRDEEPPRPSVRVSTLEVRVLSTVSGRHRIEPRRFGQQLRGELDWIVMKTLEKDRTRRYATAHELAADIQRFLNNQPVEACPPSTLYWLRKSLYRHRLVATSVLLIAAALLLGIIVSSWQAIRAERALVAEQQASEEERRQRAAAEQATLQALAADRASRLLAQQKRRLLYNADMNRAHQAWLDADLGQVVALLQRHRPHGNEPDLRSFAWYFLQELCRPGLNTPALRSSNPVYSIAYSPDGRLMAIGDRGGRVRLWDARTRERVAELGQHPHWIQALAFSPDSGLLATGDRQGLVHFWDLQTRQLLRTLPEHPGPIESLAFTPDGSMLATNWLKTVKLWDVSRGVQWASCEGHANSVTCLAFAAGAETLASGALDGTIRLWSVSEQPEPRTLIERQGPVTCLAYAPDGNTLAIGNRKGVISVLDCSSGNRLAWLAEHAGPLVSLDFSSDGEQLASGGQDQTVRLWDTGAWRLRRTLVGHSAGVFAVAFSPDGATLASASRDKLVRFWDTTRRPTPDLFRAHVQGVWALAIAPDGQTLASSGGVGQTVKLWNLATGALVRELDRHEDWVWSLAFSRDSATLAVGNGPVVQLWDAKTGALTRTLAAHAARVTAVGFSPDGRLLATGDRERTVVLWDLSDGRKRFSIEAHENLVGDLAFSRDGQALFTAGWDHRLKMWETATGTVVREFSGHDGEVYCLALSPDGRTLASGSHHVIALWDVDSGDQRAMLPAHNSLVVGLEFTPDGKSLVSSSWDRTVKVWDLVSLEARLTLKPGSDLVQKLALSPAGDTLVAGIQSGEVAIWRAPLDDSLISQTLQMNGSGIAD